MAREAEERKRQEERAQFLAAAGAQALEQGFVVDGETLQKYEGNAEQVVIPAFITAIAPRAFEGNKTMCSLIMPDSVKSVGNNAFFGCWKLETVRLSAALDEISDSCFCGCFRLKEIEIPASVKKIGHSAFHRCKGLTSVTLPSGLKTMETFAFALCDALNEIRIPPSVQYLSHSVFFLCKKDFVIYVKNPLFIPSTWNRRWNVRDMGERGDEKHGKIRPL